MPLNWIDVKDFSFNCFLMMERFQIRLMLNESGWRSKKEEWRGSMGIALNANPAVKWYFEQMCPEFTGILNDLTAAAPVTANAGEIRAAEEYALLSVEDFVIYTKPWQMETNCDFIRGWSKERLFEMADFKGKVVLDVGSGSGRLAFAAAELAKEVYASEPVGTLREFMRGRIKERGITNMRVLDGMADALPFPDDTFDIVMSGHVVGDDFEREIAELTRVCKPGGWVLDCPGDSLTDMALDEQGTKHGFEVMRYTGSFGKDVYRYRGLK